MARPIKNNADYFSHDKTMRNDPKMKYIRSKYGLEGYALYCMILEYLTDCEFFEMENSEMQILLLAGDFGIESEFLQKFFEDCKKIGLLNTENGKIFSEGLKKRLKQVNEKRKTERERKKGFCTENEVSATEIGVSARKTMVSASENTQRKRKENKEKEIKKESVFSFEKFLEKYPKHTKLESAEREFALLTESEKNEILRVYEFWIAYWKTIETKFVPNPYDWLKEKQWRRKLPEKFGNINTAITEKRPPPPQEPKTEEEEQLKQERDEREKILEFYQTRLEEEKKIEVEKFLAQKFENSLVKKGDLLYKIELVRYMKSNNLVYGM